MTDQRRMSKTRHRVTVSQEVDWFLRGLAERWVLKPAQVLGVLASKYGPIEFHGVGSGRAPDGLRTVKSGRSSEEEIREEEEEEQKSLDSSSDDSGGPPSAETGPATPEEQKLLLELRRQRAEQVIDQGKQPIANPSRWEATVLHQTIRRDAAKRKRIARQAANRARCSNEDREQVVSAVLDRERFSDALLRLAAGRGLHRNQRKYLRAMAPLQNYGYPLSKKLLKELKTITTDVCLSANADEATKAVAKEVDEWLT